MRALFLGVFLYASGLHAGWAILLLVSSAAADATAPSGIARFVPGPLYVTSAVMLSTSVLAAWIITGPRPIGPVKALGLLPQQLLLAFGAYAATLAILSGHFADGANYPRAFIAADQWSILLSASTHNIVVAAFQKQTWRAAGWWPWRE